MFKTNIFSGVTYFETKNYKSTDDGTLFTKMGHSWFGSNGVEVDEIGDQLINFKTGVMSSFGDPFKEDNHE